MPASSEQNERIEYFLQTYRDLMGFVPPRIQARFDRLRDSNPDLLLAEETVRNLISYTDKLDPKTTQLILFAVLAVNLKDATKLHGWAARRAGASWDELQATLDLAYLFGGLSVANHAPAILDGIAELEQKVAEGKGSESAPR